MKLLSVLFLALIVSVSGCSTQTWSKVSGFVEKQDLALGIAVRLGVEDYILRGDSPEAQTQTARRLLMTIERIRPQIQDKNLIAAEIYEIVSAQVDYTGRTVQQTLAIREALLAVKALIDKKISDAEIPEDATTTVLKVMEWVEVTAEHYGK